MKVLGVLLLLAAVASAFPYYANDGEAVSTAKKQEDVLHLLYRVNQPISPKFTELKDAAEHFNPTNDLSMYKDGGHAAELLVSDVHAHRVLSQHHYFSLFNEEHRHCALLIFDVLMNCKTWHCAVNNAAYAREHMNEGAFVYALYVAVIHSDVSHDIVLPPLYEITPHMFTSSEIIYKAYSAKMSQTPGKFHMDFTGSIHNKEQRVAYFGEDIGLNVHHVTWHMDFPFWWNDSHGHHFDRKGELFYWMHHQLTARFDAERLSNHLDIVDELQWDKPIVEGFAPHTTYKYGGEFPSRPDNIHFTDVDGIGRIRDLIIMEQRIRDSIAHGYVEGNDGKIDIRNEHGIDVIGDIFEASAYSPNMEYYGSLHNLAHNILGSQGDPHGKFNQPPSVMEHFETATRDPTFFRLHKYMDNIFKEHKDSLPPYTKADIEFTGIVIDDVNVKGKLETFFEDFEFDLQMAVDHSDNVDDVPISAVVSRLNHEPFDLEIDITNNNGADAFATVRVNLCPRRDGDGVLFGVDNARWRCIELDKFWRTLHTGKNHIVRHSADAATTVPDIPSYNTLLAKTEAALSSHTELDLHEYSRGCGIPNRMLLPKGTEGGMEFSLVVTLTDGHKDTDDEGLEKDERGGTHALCGIHGEAYPDKRALGYPFDRRIPDDRVVLEIANNRRVFVNVVHNAHH